MQVSLVLVLTVTLTGEGYIAAEMPNPISYVGCSGTSGADSGCFGTYARRRLVLMLVGLVLTRQGLPSVCLPHWGGAM